VVYRQAVDEGQLRRKAELAELLLNAARQLGETLEPERVYERFHELLGDVVQHDGLVVSSYDRREDLIRCDYAWVEGNVVDAASLPPLPLNRAGGGMQSRVIMSGEPMVFNDVVDRVQEVKGEYYNVDREGDVQRIPESGPSGTSAAMMVPVKHEGQVVGVVQVMTDHGEYSSEQLELVDGLVSQMAAAVRNARLQREQRRLEAAEAAAQAVAAERLQAAEVLEALGDGIFLIDAGGLVRLWNRAAESVTDVAADQVLGRSPGEVFPSWSTVMALISVAERGTKTRPVTLPVEVGGRDLWLSFVAVRSDAGIVYAFRDVTSERRLEEEKDDFVATISHELRTPMAAVYGAAQTLLHRGIDPATEPGQKLLEMISSQAVRLSHIIEEVLLTRNLDRGEVQVDRRAVDVDELVRTTALAMQGQLTPPATLEVDVRTHRAGASGDPDRIQQVLVNLLDNAVKYGGGTPVTVKVEDATQGVQVSVADRGPGIMPADRDRIFEKFFRADPQLTHAPSGTGLGLYISRELARRMGGRLYLEPASSAGATFVLELPRA
jgi:PAS domain S-box-containing protein